LGVWIEALEASPTSYIQAATGIFRQAGDQIVVQAMGVPFPVLEAGEAVLFRDEPIQTVGGTYPKVVVLVFVDTPYIIVADAGGIGGVVAPDHYFISIIPVEAVPGAEPDIASAVLEDGLDGAVGQPLFVGEVGEPQVGGLTLGKQGQREGEEDYIYNKMSQI
jgi:hypothetical protein